MTKMVKTAANTQLAEDDETPIIFTREEMDASIKRRPVMARFFKLGIEMGLARIIQDGSVPRQEANACRQFNRAIQSDANYCPYCAHPITHVPVPTITPMCVSRNVLEKCREMDPRFCEFLVETGRMKVIDE
jgi:hypothetical protein